MSGARDFVVRPDERIEDVDLEQTDVRLRDGRRLTDTVADELADEMLAEARRRGVLPGRRSLTRQGVHSPRVQFRVPESLRDAAEERAAREGISLSELAREAPEHYLAS